MVLFVSSYLMTLIVLNGLIAEVKKDDSNNILSYRLML